MNNTLATLPTISNYKNLNTSDKFLVSQSDNKPKNLGLSVLENYIDNSASQTKIKSDITSVKSDVKSLSTEIKADISTLNTTVATNTGNIASLESKTTSIQDSLNKTNSDVTNLNTTTTNLSSEIGQKADLSAVNELSADVEALSSVSAKLADGYTLVKVTDNGSYGYVTLDF